MADVKKLVTPVPPLAEQLKIAAAVDLHIRRINALVHDAELAVDLLRERRSALISAAVTGKIDVRGLAPQAEGAAA
jgi:type I restriction enzyme S subunit